MLNRVLYNRCSKWCAIAVVIVLKISPNVKNTENFSSSPSYVGKDTKMSSTYFLKLECYYKLDIVAGATVNDRQDISRSHEI